MASYPVTRVRYTEAEAQPILRVFVLGGHFGTDRPPRGVDPRHLLDFIVRTVPVNVSSGRASTRIVTSCPSCSRA